MNGDWLITDEPSTRQAAWAHSGHFFFSSPAWASALRSLGSLPIYVWSRQKEIGIIVPVFRRLGFKVGFLGFPVTGEAVDTLAPKEIQTLARTVLKARRLDLIRVTQANQNDLCGVVDSARPDVWIENLPVWSPQSKRLRRDISFAVRSASELKIIDDHVDATRCFGLYASTVTAQGGIAKYTINYFRKLASIAQQSEAIELHSVVDSSGATQAFSALVRHGTWAYYLHAAAELSAKRKGVSDLLLQHQVQRARDMGCNQFSLMSSPWDQPGLVKFKNKWGNATGLSITHDIGRGLAGAGLRAITSWQCRHDRRAAIEWAGSN